MKKPETQSALLEELLDIVSEAKGALAEWNKLPEQALHFRASAKSWSLLECVEHLIRYAQFYDTEFERKIALASSLTTDKKYKRGWLGSATAYSMRPKINNKLNKMATFKDKNPLNEALTLDKLSEWGRHLDVLEGLLNEAKGMDLNSVRCQITIPVLKFYLGDTLQFVVFHIERHLLQIRNVLIMQGLGVEV